MTRETDRHWLYRTENRSRLWIAQLLLLVLAVVPDFFLHRHAQFPDLGVQLDGIWGFYAWYGFLTCALMVVVAKLLGFALKRDERYYDE